MNMTMEKTPVLIVGGGVTGLSTALFLARHGVRPVLVERHPSTAIMPQARAFNPRTMEIYRSLGLEDEIRARQSMLVDFPEMIGVETLTGAERFRVDVLAQVRPSAVMSPTDWALVDQDELERVVRAAAERGGADIRFGTELVGVDAAGSDGVTATVRTDGHEYRIRASYLVAADGHRASVRTRLGVGVDQAGPVSHVVSFVFDADLTSALRGRRFLLAYLDRPATGAVVVPLRRFGRWALHVPYPPDRGGDDADVSEEDCVELVRQAVGDPDLEVTLVPPVPGWSRKVQHSVGGTGVASRFRVGRVFLAGDAAHVVPPAGSFGASTGIADAHNLAWKLAAVLDGTAGEALLDTYEQERRPVALTTLETSTQLMHDRQRGAADEVTRIDDLTLIFGYRYDSTAVLTEPAAPRGPVEDPRAPTGRPGLRAPHVWLHRDESRLSTLDLFRGAFTLLAGPDGADWVTAGKAAAASLGVGLDVHQVGVELHDVEGRWCDAYGVTAAGATLVRPDGFVAWRATGRPTHQGELDEVLGRVLARDSG